MLACFMGRAARFAAGAAAVAALAVAGCNGGGSSGGGGGGGGGSAITITPDPVVFAATSPGTPSMQDVTIAARQDAPGPVSITAIEIGGAAAGACTIANGPALPHTLAPGQQLVVRTQFDPPSTGDFEGDLQVTVDGGSGSTMKSVRMTGTGVAPGIVVSPQPVAFGTIGAGTSPAPQRVTIRNTAADARQVTEIALTDDGGGQLGLSSLPSLPATIAGGGTLTFDVTLHPTNDGDLGGEVRVSSNDPDRPQVLVPVTATITTSQTTGSEFQVNRNTTAAQRKPSVAALPAAGANGTVAVVLYEDNGTATGNESTHQHYAAAPVAASGSPGGSSDGHIAHHTEGVGYITIKADAGQSNYACGGRYHPSNVSEPHPHSLFTCKVGSDGGDNGGKLALDQAVLPSGQGLAQIDIACDSPDNRRLIVFRLVGTSTDPAALPPGCYGRVVPTAGTTFVTPPFLLSTAPTTGQTNPHVDWNGSRYLAIWVEAGVVSGRMFGPGGDPLTGDFAISDGAGGASAPQLAVNPRTGDFLVVWKSAEISGRVVHGDGSMDAVVAQLDATAAGTQDQPAAACDSQSGAWLVVWTGPDASGRGIFARQLAADLASGGDDIPVNVQTSGDQTDPAATFCPGNGKWLVVWSGADQDGAGVKGRFLDRQ